MCVVGPQASPVLPHHLSFFAFGSTVLALRGTQPLPRLDQELPLEARTNSSGIRRALDEKRCAKKKVRARLPGKYHR